MHAEKEELRKEAIKSFEKFELKTEPGSMPTDKLRVALRGLGFEPHRNWMKALIIEFDKEQTGLISKEDFLKIAMRKFDEKDKNNEILKAFDMFDLKKEGRISFQDLKRVAEELDENITDEELREMIEEADKNKDNYVDRDEFLEIMKKTALY